MNIKKIDDLKYPPIVGEYCLVPCIISHKTEITWLEEWDNVDAPSRKKKIGMVYPIINHLHDDKDTGQFYQHYHTDFRFVDIRHYYNERGFEVIVPFKRDSRYNFAPSDRFNLISKELAEKWQYSHFIKEVTCTRLIKKKMMILKGVCILQNLNLCFLN